MPKPVQVAFSLSYHQFVSNSCHPTGIVHFLYIEAISFEEMLRKNDIILVETNDISYPFK